MAVEALFAVFIGLSGGLAVGSGFVAFISVLGIIPRLVQLTRTDKAIQAYETAVITGAVIGSIATLHDIKGAFPEIFTIPVGLFAGMFVGMLAAALTEVLNVFPILARRIGMEKNIMVLVMAIVAGKILGSLFHWIFFVTY
ncbi:stage V sporulation protein AB [Alteribacillus persepolensis]|uniref:Stage V sporulation protein AB n=1 Tax=Alteribacillus persepolensis TaxID=568899 RepID=A0A1G7ZNT1_9BACI|nr:stage V sporulation protein AB [Alteribacillus persepolensis]SDH10216.1 stage V sporulation protein AB [Alteribacillus persepolensis]